MRARSAPPLARLKAPLLAALLTALSAASGCGHASSAGPHDVHAPAGARLVTLSIVGTNDLHGHVEALPAFSGYVANLRAAREEDGGAVLLVDAGDLFQGTLASNLAEGMPVVEAYEALGYDAVAIGNHEFDYGPVGPRATPTEAGDEPRGALARLVERAPFPFLGANLVERATQRPARLRGGDAVAVPATARLTRAGVEIGLLGVTSAHSLDATISANVSDLAVEPLLDTVLVRARALREQGAEVVVVLAHAGGRCERDDDPSDTSSCAGDEEIMALAAGLPEGLVDAIVAGHTHQTMAHVVHGVPIIESRSYGQAFGRIDLEVDRERRHAVRHVVFPPTEICRAEACADARYEGRPIAASEDVSAIVTAAEARAAELRARPLGVELTGPVTRSHTSESALGDLFTDLMLRARPDARVALYNGGGLRADLPAGALTYGAFFEALPFDNRFARIETTASALAALLVANASGEGGFLSVAGVRAILRCEGPTLVADLTTPEGAPIPSDARITILTSDFLATGGDALFTAERARGAVSIEGDPPMREAMIEALRAGPSALDPAALYDPARPRVVLPGPRPVRCTP